MTHNLLPDGREDKVRAEVTARQLDQLVTTMRRDADFLDTLDQSAGANLARSNADALESTLDYMRGIQR